jgi:enoyl-CoA hydratase/carnithine racemase
MNRPRQFNALSGQTVSELSQCLHDFEESEQSVLVLTGAGRAFCFGADFTEFQNREQLPQLLELFQNFILKFYHCSKITIAALNGFATGAGLDLALACDLRLASDRAKLGEAYVSMGLVPDCGGSYFLPQMVGSAKALQLLVSGDSMTPAEAKALRLVEEVYPADQLSGAALTLATQIAEKPQTALRLIKRLLRTPAGNLESALLKERDAQLLCFEDPEHRSIVEDFLRKRR